MWVSWTHGADGMHSTLPWTGTIASWEQLVVTSNHFEIKESNPSLQTHLQLLAP